jgi:Cu/Ag efflux protein CusF
MKNRIFTCAFVAATAVNCYHDGARAFSPGGRSVARVLRTEFSLVQAQDQPNGLFRGVGVVTAINPATGSLTINHQEIVGLMPPMEMLFHVDPRTLSDGVKPGDKIEFRVEGKTYKIRDIKVIEHTK